MPTTKVCQAMAMPVWHTMAHLHGTPNGPRQAQEGQGTNTNEHHANRPGYNSTTGKLPGREQQRPQMAQAAAQESQKQHGHCFHTKRPRHSHRHDHQTEEAPNRQQPTDTYHATGRGIGKQFRKRFCERGGLFQWRRQQHPRGSPAPACKRNAVANGFLIVFRVGVRWVH